MILLNLPPFQRLTQVCLHGEKKKHAGDTAISSQFPTEHIVEMGIGVEHDIRISRRINQNLILDFVMYSIKKTYRYSIYKKAGSNLCKGEGNTQGWKEGRGRARREAEGNEMEVKDRPGRRKGRNKME